MWVIMVLIMLFNPCEYFKGMDRGAGGGGGWPNLLEMAAKEKFIE